MSNASEMDSNEAPSASANPDPARAIRVVVHGKVQRVTFRESCRRVADVHAVRGFVRNLSDGTVEAVFEGHPDAVDTLVEWCHAGPERAVVARVEVIESSPIGATGFEVRETI